MYNEIDVIIGLINELRFTNSRTEKETILKKYCQREDFKEILEKLFHAVYDYDKQYYITSANILKKNLIQQGIFFGKNYSYIWDLLEDLSSRLITGHNAIIAVQQFLKNKTEEQKQIYLNIIDKDLKCGLQAATINKIIPGLIKTYDVALANKFDSKKDTLDSNWVIERKLDGVRCNVINKNGIIKCYSRQGKEITTLGNLINELQDRLPNNTVLDGEVCLVDDKGLESFNGIMKQIKRKNHTIENPLLLAFDMLTLEEFENKKGNIRYTQRVERLKEWYSLQSWETSNKVAKHLSVINYEIYSPEVLKEWEERVKKYNWEGLMFRKDIGYEGKRTQNLLKYKMFQDAEYKIVGVEEGDAQELVDGVMKKIKCVGALVIEHKGNKVGVGTGLSLEQRKRWYSHPEEIIGKICTIKFFEETTDKNGNPSLRFPVLKAIYENERDI